MEITIIKMQANTSSVGENLTDFEVLFQQHWEPVCALIYRITGDWHEAQDLALEAFVQLHQHPPAQPDNIRGWLYRVAVRLGLNMLRSRKRRRYYELQSVELFPIENDPDNPARLVEQIENRHRVELVLAQMKPRSAELLMLRYSGFSYIELASAARVKPGSVGVLLSRAEKEFEKRYIRLVKESEL